MPPAAIRRVLALLIASFALGGLAFALGTPTFQNPDEPSHLDLAHHYAHHPFDLAGPGLRVRQDTVAAVDQVGLSASAGPISYTNTATSRPPYRALDDYPNAGQPATSGCLASCQNYQYAHPPGWYLAMAPVVRLFDGLSFPSLVFLLRALNVLLALGAVPLTWYTARQVWPDAVTRPLVAAAAVAFCGPYLATAAAVNNDAAVLGLSAATAALMARTLRRGSSLPSAALLGAVVGVGLLVKAQFVVLAPLAGLAVLFGPVVVARWRAVFAFATPALIGAHWWIATLVRDGSLTPAGSELVQPASPGPWERTSLVNYVIDHTGDLHRRFFGLYGWASVEVPDLWHTTLTIATCVAVAAWLAARRWDPPTLESMRWWLLAAVPAGLVAASFKASFDVYRLTGEVRGLAPRYLYPAVPLLAVGLAAAGGAVAARLPRRLRAPLAAIAVGLLALVAGVGSFVLAVTGLLDSTSIGRMVERADVVSPVGAPAMWLAALAIGWTAATVAAVISVWRGPPGQRATTPMVVRPSSFQSPATGRQPAAP